jgi:hypothetical protein
MIVFAPLQRDLSMTGAAKRAIVKTAATVQLIDLNKKGSQTKADATQRNWHATQHQHGLLLCASATQRNAATQPLYSCWPGTTQHNLAWQHNTTWPGTWRNLATQHNLTLASFTVTYHDRA